MAPASLTDFHWLFSVPSSKCCSSTSDRLWPLPSTSVPVHYAPASHCLMMDTDTDMVEWSQSSHFVYNVLWYWQTGEWEVLTAGSTPRQWRLKCVPCTDEKCIYSWMMKLFCRDFIPSTLTQNSIGTAYSPLWQSQIKIWCIWTCCSSMWPADNEAANLQPKWVWHVIFRTRTCTEWSSRL